jgi:hypothetical protein
LLRLIGNSLEYRLLQLRFWLLLAVVLVVDPSAVVVELEVLYIKQEDQ